MKARCPHGAPWHAACAVCDEAEILAGWNKLPAAFWVGWGEMSPEVRRLWEGDAVDYSNWKGPPASAAEIAAQLQRLWDRCRAEGA